MSQGDPDAADVHIHYLRPPDREEVFHQHLVHEGDDVLVTLARDLEFDPPVRIRGRPVLETGSEVVWLTFPGAWHDIGRFHTADGTFQGFYANVLTPPTFEPGGVWRTTDLFLDVWLEPGAPEPLVLDRDELETAAREGWVDRETRERAEQEAERIVAAAAEGRWPPPPARAWTLERARKALYSSTTSAAESRSTST